MLKVRNLHVKYGAIHAVRGINVDVPEGQIVTLIGANGAGKTSTLHAISGLLKIHSGSIEYQGQSIHRLPAHQLVAHGLCHVPEGRMIFANLSVMENLKMGAYLRHDKLAILEDLDYVLTLFPRLKERLQQEGGTLSGGEQQMLAIARALMSKPKFLMLDEPSLGIAPLLVRGIFEQIVTINQERGLTILLVEQNANLALEISHQGYVLETGEILLQDSSHRLKENPQVKAAYLGL